jgi:hypothetical protein
MLRKKGAVTDLEIFGSIEAHRARLGGGGELPSPLTLSSYVKYRLAVEHPNGLGLSEAFVERAIQRVTTLFAPPELLGRGGHPKVNLGTRDSTSAPNARPAPGMDVSRVLCPKCGRVQVKRSVCLTCANDISKEPPYAQLAPRSCADSQADPEFVHTNPRETADHEQLVKLCHGVFDRFATFLESVGIDRPLNAIEAIAASMFLTTEAYCCARGESGASDFALHRFQVSMLNDYLGKAIERGKPCGSTDAARFRDLFYHLLKERYNEYRATFRDELRDPDSLFRETLCAFAGHLFAEPIPNEEGLRLLPAAAAELSESFSAAVKALKVLQR